METKKFKIQKTERTKGGLNNTRTVLTGAGIAAVGGGAAGAGYAAMTSGKDTPVDPEKTNGQNAQTVSEATEAQQGQQQATTQQQTSSSGQQPSPDEYHPTDNGGSQTAVNQPTNGGGTTGTMGEEVDPNLVAQELRDELDPGDIDSPDMLIVEEFGTVYGPDGNEMNVAIVHTPDGSRYQLADIDGDGVFSDVFDMAGNFVGEADGNLTVSDLYEMADNTGGYLPPDIDDPTGGITDTGGGVVGIDSPELVDGLPLPLDNDDPLSEEELLALLENELTPVDGVDEEVIIDEAYEDDFDDEIAEVSEDYDVTENDGEYEYEG